VISEAYQDIVHPCLPVHETMAFLKLPESSFIGTSYGTDTHEWVFMLVKKLLSSLRYHLCHTDFVGHIRKV